MSFSKDSSEPKTAMFSRKTAGRASLIGGPGSTQQVAIEIFLEGGIPAASLRVTSQPGRVNNAVSTHIAHRAYR